MKLYILRPNSDYQGELWAPWWDKVFGFVVRAKSEAAARQQAAGYAGDEGDEAWTNPEYSTCTELSADGIPEIILRDFAAG